MMMMMMMRRARTCLLLLLLFLLRAHSSPGFSAARLCVTAAFFSEFVLPLMSFISALAIFRCESYGTSDRGPPPNNTTTAGSARTTHDDGSMKRTTRSPPHTNKRNIGCHGAR